jgi:hypothetical protein
MLGAAQPARSAGASIASEPVGPSDIVNLSPFMVSDTDDSWTATSTLVGNRTKQELAKVPASIDVITAEFIRDLSLGSLEDSAAFVAGLTVQPRFESRNDDSRVSYRGLSGASTTSRNFFMWYVPSDTYNVERFDFNKGSNSLMFGDSAPGGQATIYTKRPKKTPLTELYGSYSSFDTTRLQLDLSRPITDRWAVRINAVDRVDRTYVEHNYQRLRAGDIALSFQPFPATTLVIDGERGEYERRRADNALAILDLASPGKGYSQNNRWYYTSDGAIIQRPNAAIPSSDTTASSGNSVSLLSGQSVAVGLPGGIRKTFYGYSRFTDILGTNDYLDRPYNVFSATLDQGIGKLELEIAYNQQFQHQDRNDNSFGTSQTPPVISVDGSGRPYVDETGSVPFKVFGNIVKAARASAAYPFVFGRWMKQYLVVSALRQKDYASSRRFFIANDAGPGSIMNNIVTFRAYLDDPKLTTPAFWDQFLLPNLPSTATFHPVVMETYVNTGPYVDIRYNRSLSASLSGEYFGGRLNSLAGISWSRVSRKIPAAYTYALDSTGRVTSPGTPDQNPAAYVYDPGYDFGARSTTLGLTYQLFNRDKFNLNLYADYSQSFNWQSGQTFFGQVLGPVLGQTRELGVKTDLFDRQVFVTAAAFGIQRQNVAYAWLPDNLSAVNLEDLINPNNLKPGDPGYRSVVNGLNNERRTVNSSERSKGGEITIQGRRKFGLQARVTLAYIRVETTPDFSVFKTLLASAVARTSAATAAGGDPTLAESAVNIANAQTIIGSNTLTKSVTGRRGAPVVGSFVLDYAVPKVRALRVGVNGVYTTNYNIAIFNGVAYKGGAQFPLGAYAIYDRKLWRQHFTLRGGAQNIWDVANGSSPYRKTGATGFNNSVQRPNYIYRYIDPVIYSISLTANF